MPIQAEYTWSERLDQIRFQIPLKGISAKKVDVEVSGRHLKVNFDPYLLDIVLFGEIKPLVSQQQHNSATVKNGILSITLHKASPAIWGQCEADLDKESRQAVRKEAQASQSTTQEELSVKRVDRRIAEEKKSLRKQMALDEEVRSTLEQKQQEEKQEAEKDLYDTLAKLTPSSLPSGASAAVPHADPVAIPSVPASSSSSSSSSSTTTFNVKQKGVFTDEDIEALLRDEDIDDEDESVKERNANKFERKEIVEEDLREEEEEDIRYVPPPRQVAEGTTSKVSISFSQRLFPTPKRESKLAEEEDWIAKNRQHLKKHGVLGQNLKRGNGVDITEGDPLWLKAKGDDFFRAGDSQSALNAYSAAIDLDSNFTACYANRAACYLKMGHYLQCKADCDKTIEQTLSTLSTLTRSTQSNTQGKEKEQEEEPARQERMKLLSSLVKALCRRGAALCQLGLFTESLTDYVQAQTKFQLLDGNTVSSLGNISLNSIQSDIERLKLLCSVENAKKEGDRLVGEHQLLEARSKYDEALAVLPIHVSSLSNRSACKIALGDLHGAVEDCQLAVNLLTYDDNSKPGYVRPAGMASEGAASMLSSILPPKDSPKRKQWLLRTLVRQAVALTQLERFDQAINAYKHACRLDPQDKILQADLEKLLAMQKDTTAKIAE
eukprot:gene3781-4129_t